MSFASSLFRRACDPADPNSAACEKPTSNVLLDAVPAAIVGVLVFLEKPDTVLLRNGKEKKRSNT